MFLYPLANLPTVGMTSNTPLLGALISFFLPGLGLLLSKENKFKGGIIFLIAMVADFVSIIVATVLTLCIVGIILYLAPLVIHFLAAIHTHDVLVKEEKGGKPLVFG